MISESDVLQVLKKVMDPELHVDVVTLKMIKDVVIENDNVSFTLELTTPACPFNSQIEADVRKAVEFLPGVGKVDMKTTARVWTGRPQFTEDMLRGVKNIVAVASGKGGVGKSTVAANVAIALAEMGSQVGLVDADIYGPSVPKVLNILVKPIPDAGKKIVPAQTYLGVRVMSLGLFVSDDTAMIWRGPMVSQAIKQLLTEANWGELDYLIVDLPPGTGDASLTIAQTIPVTGVVIVSTPQIAAVNIATKALRMFRRLDIPIIGVVENMSLGTCPHCGRELDIFGSGGAKEAANETGSFFLGEIHLSPDVRVHGDQGRPVIVANPESRSAEAFRALGRTIAGRVSVIAHARLTGKASALA